MYYSVVLVDLCLIFRVVHREIDINILYLLAR